MDSLVPKDSNPFYIVSPPFTRASAGINALYILCNYLNEAGERAFIVNYLPGGGGDDGPESFRAPILNQDYIDFYHIRKITPVVIYPEVFDNPLSAPFFGRYILNYPGKASLSRYSAVENFAVAYSRSLAEYCTKFYSDRPAVEDVLFIPAMDLAFWNRTGEAPIRRGSCFYAGKMRRVHGKSPDSVPEDSIEIHNDVGMTRADIRRYFWRSEVFYCFEDSALAIEAQLCGCPTVFIPNFLFSGMPLANYELGRDGSCVSGEEDGLQRASVTVSKVEAIVRGHLAGVPTRIAELGAKWKAHATNVDYQGTIDYPFEPRLVFMPKSNSAYTQNSHQTTPLPATVLDYPTMREIAREVWYEANRHSVLYKASRLLKVFQKTLLSTFRQADTIRVKVAAPSAVPTMLENSKIAPKRIVFFAHFDKDGVIDDYVIHYLKALKQISLRVLFMSDCNLRNGEAHKLDGIAELVFAAPHAEYDFGSWKRGFAALNYDLSDWDELIIANDSCYAPLFSLEQAFSLIGECDFWGATKEPYSRLAADIAARRAERANNKEVPKDRRAHGQEEFEFLNSYFMVFKRNILIDSNFINFWINVSTQENKEDVIERYEMGLTHALLSLDYKFSCFAIRKGVIAYEEFLVNVPEGFQLPWLRALICKKNDELIPEIDKQLDCLKYPRYLIDKHVERMIGTAHPPHYYLPAKRPFFQSISFAPFRKKNA